MSRLTVPVQAGDHAEGEDDAQVTLVEYGDYQCPYCGMAYPIVKEIQSKMGGKLRFVFRNFPLTESHPHALAAASAAEAAGLQGRFWEMHDTLYENQRRLGDEDLVAYARKLKLDIQRFTQDVNSDQVESRIRDDVMGGIRSGVNGTPTFYINGVRHDGSFEYEELLAALQEHSEPGGESRSSSHSQKSYERKMTHANPK